MSELILIRHGETAWTLSGQHTGHTDLPLTARGEDQARALVPLLADRRITLALVSPYQRARRTAELAGLTSTRVTDDLREWDYGGYEGLTTAEIHRTLPHWDMWTDGVAPGPAEHPGESAFDVGERADRVLAEVREALSPGGGDIALVAHSHVLRVLTARYLGLAPAAGALFQLATGTVSSLGTEHGRPVITGWNLALPARFTDAATSPDLAGTG
ncbi:histidine phosphatase family protein [Streptomyces lunaelactis]|uniref:histidine phosphatase family protein n=1 Tax=Streptomyces lunaelactis TaxID=1535768 RepID=UPI0015855F70|nr:histidine phosphatase family protein [Streptomyces lunaelactis]NUK07419.1 histidine phosphatase family protein [Streptomyces lunaelactis]NUK22137.1 histidine phosphatase family protein [Streptomyces lunaelactis]NUK38525.1 histidine phosphatase family protein [Streptomyces lunaelactis]NUK40124.1 histidine phosphatase family protein [Streptomyces lunaelactis]NUK56481.1 histidine phosphatase family protein [Streptomyces lunaelactis]